METAACGFAGPAKPQAALGARRPLLSLGVLLAQDGAKDAERPHRLLPALDRLDRAALVARLVARQRLARQPAAERLRVHVVGLGRVHGLVALLLGGQARAEDVQPRPAAQRGVTD